MFSISVEAEFSAAHKLKNYKGKCEALHGHNWKVRVYLSSERLDENGLVFDFIRLKKYLRGSLKALDHKMLNRIDYFKKNNPTSENIARYIYFKMAPYFEKNKSVALERVCVWETQTSCACFKNE